MKSSILILIAGWFLSGCSSLPLATCQISDWYTQGQTDGIQAKMADAHEGYRPSCPQIEKKQNFQAYHSGRMAGLVQYCQPFNAYQVGRTGATYKVGLCPSHLEKKFLEGLSQGQRVLFLETTNLELKQQLHHLTTPSERAPASQKTRLELMEHASLSQQIQKNEREISALEEQIRSKN